MDPDWQAIGQEVRRLMTGRMWNAPELARRAQVDRHTVDRLIEGDYKRGPDLDTVRGIFSALAPEGIQVLRDHGLEGWADNIENHGEELSPRMRELIREYVDSLVSSRHDESDDPGRT